MTAYDLSVYRTPHSCTTIAVLHTLATYTSHGIPWLTVAVRREYKKRDGYTPSEQHCNLLTLSVSPPHAVAVKHSVAGMTELFKESQIA